jgi:hypothetical protein
MGVDATPLLETCAGPLDVAQAVRAQSAITVRNVFILLQIHAPVQTITGQLPMESII